MKKLLLVLCLLSTSALADSKIVGHIKPLPNELLKHPIRLSKCGDVVITEWKDGPNRRAFDRIERTCILSVKNFVPFMQSKNIDIKYRRISQKISLIPADSESGKQYRALNDIKYRFRYREIKDDLWGYFSYGTKYIFIENKPIINGKENKRFNETLAHELFHAQVFFYKLNTRFSEEKEEELAEEFTDYIGVSYDH